MGVAFTLSCPPALAHSLYDDGRRARVLAPYGSLFVLAGLLAPLAGDWAMDRLCLPLRLRGRATARAAATDVVGAAVAADSMAAAASGRPDAPMPWWSTRLWRTPGLARANAASALLQFASFALVLVMPFYLVRQGGWSPGAIGLTMACWASGTMLGSALAARWIRANGLTSAAVWGTGLSALGLTIMALWPAQAQLVLTMVVQGWGWAKQGGGGPSCPSTGWPACSTSSTASTTATKRCAQTGARTCYGSFSAARSEHVSPDRAIITAGLPGLAVAAAQARDPDTPAQGHCDDGRSACASAKA